MNAKSQIVTALVKQFEGSNITTIRYKGQEVWITREIGRAWKYAGDGKGLIEQTGGEWQDEFEPTDTILLEGEELRALKQALGPELVQRLGLAHAPSLLLYTESGLYKASLLSRKPEGKRLRKWLAENVLPELRRTGQYAVAQAAPQVSTDSAVERALMMLQEELREGREERRASRQILQQLTQQLTAPARIDPVTPLAAHVAESHRPAPPAAEQPEPSGKPTDEPLLSSNELATTLGISARTFLNWRKAHPALQQLALGGANGMLWRLSEVLQWRQQEVMSRLAVPRAYGEAPRRQPRLPRPSPGYHRPIKFQPPPPPQTPEQEAFAREQLAKMMALTEGGHEPSKPAAQQQTEAPPSESKDSQERYAEEVQDLIATALGKGASPEQFSAARHAIYEIMAGRGFDPYAKAAQQSKDLGRQFKPIEAIKHYHQGRLMLSCARDWAKRYTQRSSA